MNATGALRILVVGDSYCPSSAFREAFRRLDDDHEVTFADVVDEPGWRAAHPVRARAQGVPGQPRPGHRRARRPRGARRPGRAGDRRGPRRGPGLRLVCCARGGPVNVDVAAATARGIPVVTTPGKNADAVAELTIAFMVMLARRLPEVLRHVEAGGEFGHDNYEGARWFGHDLAGHTLGLSASARSAAGSPRRALAFGMRVLVSDPFVDPAADRRGRRRAGRPRRACSSEPTSCRSTPARRPTTGA